MPRLHLSCQSLTANWGRGRKNVVLLARVFIFSSRNFFRADERNFRDSGGNLPCARLRRAGGGFSPLLVASRRHGRRRAMLAASPAAPAAPLPKNLAALRFSGALFFRAVDPSLFLVISTEKGCKPAEWRNLARCVSVSKRLPFHAFPFFKGEGGPLAVDEG